MDLEKNIVDRVLGMNITQEELGNYLGVTRQTVAKIKSGVYFHLNKSAEKKLLNLEKRTPEEISKILEIESDLETIKEMVISRDSSYIDAAYEGIHYMYYWLMSNKFKDQENFHKYFYGHLNNFYPRFNQAALFMRDTLNRQTYPLMTMQIDYENDLVIDACLKSFTSQSRNAEFDLSDVSFPLTFHEFLDLLSKKVKPSLRFLFYKDYIDDDFEYFVEKVKKTNLKEEVYDLSRLFNFFDNDQRYYGPLLEDALSQFNIPYSLETLLGNCRYRADKIVELVNMVSLQALAEKKRDKSSLLFDSHGARKDISFQNQERRKLKKNYFTKENNK